MSKPTDLVQGTLDLLILKVVALEPMHGWAIAQRIRQMSGEVLHVGQSALYPSLHKLEQNGWIRSEWAVSENNKTLNTKIGILIILRQLGLTLFRISVPSFGSRKWPCTNLLF